MKLWENRDRLKELAQIEYEVDESDDDWNDDQSETKDTLVQPTRQAGIDMGQMSDEDGPGSRQKKGQGKRAAAKAKAGSKLSGKSASAPVTPSAATPNPATPTTGRSAIKTHEDSVNNAGKSVKSSSAQLDDEMKFVAEKYVASGAGGSSLKSLEGLKVETFLAETKVDSQKDERSLSGFLRGVIPSGGCLVVTFLLM